MHVRSWRIGHRGLYPQDVLDAVSVEEREPVWRDTLAVPSPGRIVLVAERAGSIVGFASGGPARERSNEATAEVYELFVDPEVLGTGTGHALFRATLNQLERAGFDAVTIWVVEGNELARRFYEREGLVADGMSKRAKLRDAEVTEIRYSASISPPGSRGSIPRSGSS